MTSTKPLQYFVLSDLRFQTKQTFTRQYVTCIEHTADPSVCFPGTFTGPGLPEGLTVSEYSYPRWYPMGWIQHRLQNSSHFFREPGIVHKQRFRDKNRKEQQGDE
jgi:hypothetical protein